MMVKYNMSFIWYLTDTVRSLCRRTSTVEDVKDDKDSLQAF
jgi:hypothetical protein